MLLLLWSSLEQLSPQVVQFFKSVDWPNAGGDSFVQLWTGLNLAFLAWDKYQGVLGAPLLRSEQIIEATANNLLDYGRYPRIVKFFAVSLQVPRFVLKCFHYVCRVLAGACFLFGVFLLYAHRCASWDWVLILPTIAYVVVGLVALIVTGFLGYFLEPASGAKVAKEIKQAEAASKRRR